MVKALLLLAAISFSQQRDHDASLLILNSMRSSEPEVLFHRAVAQYSLSMRKEAEQSLDSLEGFNVADPPERYLELAKLMRAEMSTWKKDDLGDIARKMGDVKHRLANDKGGPVTQAKQKAVLDGLDRLIKEIEDAKEAKLQAEADAIAKAQQEMQKQQAANNPQNPLDDSELGGIVGKGQVDHKKLMETAKVWGKLPEKERAAAMLELTRGLPPRYREVVENYFRKLAQVEAKQP